jgi:hypothetical protein
MSRLCAAVFQGLETFSKPWNFSRLSFPTLGTTAAFCFQSLKNASLQSVPGNHQSALLGGPRSGVAGHRKNVSSFTRFQSQRSGFQSTIGTQQAAIFGGFLYG